MPGSPRAERRQLSANNSICRAHTTRTPANGEVRAALLALRGPTGPSVPALLKRPSPATLVPASAQRQGARTEPRRLDSDARSLAHSPAP